MQTNTIIDLVKKSEQYKREAIKQKGLRVSNGKFSRGDIVEFWGGYNDDIRYRAEVAGVIGDDIYLIWDCFWFPVKDDSKRNIVNVSKEGE